MLIAGEASGDLLAAELVSALFARRSKAETGAVLNSSARVARKWPKPEWNSRLT